jgi:hypothetical protein
MVISIRKKFNPKLNNIKYLISSVLNFNLFPLPTKTDF